MLNSRTAVSLTVTWDAATGYIESYSVTIKDIPHTMRTIDVQETRITTFSGLTAGTKYPVDVVSLSGDQRSQILEGSFVTSKFMS